MQIHTKTIIEESMGGVEIYQGKPKKANCKKKIKIKEYMYL
jgi:hypothetical protein